MSKLLNYRNAVHDVERGLVDLEVESDVHGWIPTTFIIDSIEPHQEEIFADLVIETLPIKDAFVPLDELVNKKVLQVKKLRTLALTGAAETVTTADGRRWQINKSSLDDLARSLTLGLALGELPSGTYWRDVENTSHPASLALLREIAMLAAVRHDAIWKASWQHIDALRACTTQEALDAYQMPLIL